MNTNTANSSTPKNKDDVQKSFTSDQMDFSDIKDIKNTIEDSSKSGMKEIKNKSDQVKENVKSYIQAHPFKCLAYVALSTLIFSKFF